MPTETQLRNAQRYIENPFIHPGLILRPKTKLLFTVSTYPSFTPHFSFSVGEFENTFFLRRVVFEQNRSTLTHEPQTYCCEAEIENEVVAKINDEFSTISFPPFIEPSILGIDGTSFEIVYYTRQKSISFSWWCDAPKEWKNLEQLHHKISLELNNYLPKSTLELLEFLTSG